MTLPQRVKVVEQRIRAACERSRRDRNNVHVIAVTKYISQATMGQVIHAGFTHVGENRWQDAAAKWKAFSTEAIWHFIGSLQTNKVKEVVGKFAYIHSLDRISLAEVIERRAAELDERVRCFVQINISGEKSKHGLQPEQAFSFIDQLRAFSHIEPIGLMTMAPYEALPEQTRPVFRRLRELRNELEASLCVKLRHLSMGMSNDFEIAVEEGATWVRLGSILVGREGEM